jgi:Zn-dependent protease with chaperone function
MNFFAHQDSARRRTILLVVLLFAALAVVVFAVYALTIVGLKFHGAYNLRYTVESRPAPLPFWNPRIFSIVLLGVSALVLGGSVWKYRQLSAGGGWTVAQMVGADSLCPDTQDADEKRFLNVVEEMSIASGVPVPMIFVMRATTGINAFVAGTSSEDVVLVVTQGCLATLSRDEQQAVVAHEFSHILNGDMRFNLRLMGIVHGILILAIIGRQLLRPRVRDARAMTLLVASGIMLLAVGTLGAFMGRLIKFAITRQREFLADAYAVQFTRNPGAMVKVLMRIKAAPTGAYIRSPQAEAVSHMFFAEGLSAGLTGLFATHPPVETRIRRIDPTLNAAAIERISESIQASTPAAAGGPDLSELGVSAFAGAPEPAPLSNFEQLQFAQRFLAALPAPVVSAVRQSDGAEAALYAMLLSPEPDVRRKQLERIAGHGDPEVKSQVQSLLVLLAKSKRETRLMLADLAMPALKRLSAERLRRLKENVLVLGAADRRIDLFEYALQQVFLKRAAALDPAGNRPGKIRYRAVDQLQMEIAELVSILAWQANRDPGSAEAAFQKGMGSLGQGAGPLRIIPREKCGLRQLDNALNCLIQASFKVRQRVLLAVEGCFFAGAGITLEKIALMRVVANALDIPPAPLAGRTDPVASATKGPNSRSVTRRSVHLS